MDGIVVGRIEACCEKVTESGCWIWMGACGRRGYGQVQYRGRVRPAHKAILLGMDIEVPPGRVVMHVCDVPACCNPAHLRIGTYAENTRDAMTKGRMKRQFQRAERHIHSRLTSEQVLAIRQDDRPNKEIAAYYGVVRGTISDIKSGRRWQWLMAA